MVQYTLIFGAALLWNVVITVRSSAWYERNCGAASSKSKTNNKNLSSDNNAKTDDTSEASRHATLLRKYLIVYLLATLSDWLQGPYVYALYDAYGYSQHAIAILFVAGFGSSMVFGSFVGGMADWGGRRRFVVLFAITYGASCLTKHFKEFNILMLGRLLGGVATSLLFSVFEAWLIRSHNDNKIGKTLLSKSFSAAAYGNSIIAIIAGLLANKAASSTDMVPLLGNDPETATVYMGGFLNPFDIALVALMLCGTLAGMLWEENYGDDDRAASSSENDSSSSSNDDGRTAPNWYDGLKNAFIATMRSRDILLCGIISSLFEGSMYIFVFMWTPALTAHLSSESQTKQDEEETALPFGLIFSTFMVCCMAGSSLFSILIGRYKGEALAVLVFGVASLAMFTVATSSQGTTAFVAMNIFEMTVGMYFPIMGTMKGGIVPEDKRAAIYNLYRIPLNFIVLFSLLTDLTPTQSFMLNGFMLGTATLLQMILMKRRLRVTSMADVKQENENDDDDAMLEGRGGEGGRGSLQEELLPLSSESNTAGGPNEGSLTQQVEGV